MPSDDDMRFLYHEIWSANNVSPFHVSIKRILTTETMQLNS